MSQLSAPVRHPVLACADRVEAALKDATGVDPVFMRTPDKAEALVRLTALVDQLEVLRMRVIAASGDVADHDGAPNVASWLAPRTRSDHRPAHRTESLADALDSRWTLLGDATSSGRVTLAQAEVIARALDTLDTDPDTHVEPDLLRRAEAHFIDQASLFTPRQLRVLGERVLGVICPDTYDDHERARLLAAERRASAATRLTMTLRGDGSVDLRARIPEAAASRLRTYLEAFTAPRQHQPGTRTPHEHRMGQAFCALLERLDPDTLPEHGGAATRVVVTVALGDLLHGLGTATLADGTRITADQARRLACTAAIIPAVLGGPSEVLDLGRTQRLFTPAQRRALGVRHRECRAQDCTVPATWCEKPITATPGQPADAPTSPTQSSSAPTTTTASTTPTSPTTASPTGPSASTGGRKPHDARPLSDPFSRALNPEFSLEVTDLAGNPFRREELIGWPAS